MQNELREKLAEYAHEAWSGWMRYMFKNGGAEYQLFDTGLRAWVMLPQKQERWQRQMNTPYADLPESEKTSDRDEADKMLTIVDSKAQLIALEDKILDIIAEFGDDPVQCLEILAEDIQLRQHYRAYPNAPRVEEPI